MRPEDVLPRLRRLGFGDADAATLAEHFVTAERLGRAGHGVSRVAWLETLPDLDPNAVPERVERSAGFERWHGRGAVGYLTLARICDTQIAEPPERARLVVADRCFPTGMLGLYARRLADAGLLAALTATSPARLPPPGGGAPVVGTNPLAIGIPSSDARPVVVDVSMGKVTYGDVIRGAATTEELVPFGGDQAHKAFALAVGLQLLVDSLVREEGFGAVLLVARPDSDPVPALRERARGVRLPGDRYD